MLDMDIINKFKIPGKFKDIKKQTSGIINKTYVATFEEGGEEHQYTIQKINNHVFKNPEELMNNFEQVTSFLDKEFKKNNDKVHKTINVVKTINDKNILEITNAKGKLEYYRAYTYINNCICYNNSQDEDVIRNVGKGFGNFQRMLNDYPMDTLVETIKDFHNTKKRVEHFKSVVEKDEVKRADSVKREISFILDRQDSCGVIVDKLENKEIPYRVTHNDTKVNNVLMCKESKDFLAVIDLDTVMPGSGLYDYGDGIRSAASSALEDETDLSKVYLKNNLFEAYTDGYLSEMAKFLKDEEVKLMGQSIKIVAYELGMRFLDDYLSGDKYFKCDYENHNLDRARNQLKLVEDIENKMDYINNYINESYNKYKNK